MTAAGPPVDEAAVAEVVDNRGLLCAQGILRLMRALLPLPPGSVVKVLSTDRAAEADYPAWCRNTGHAFLGHAAAADARWGSLVVSYLRKKGGS